MTPFALAPQLLAILTDPETPWETIAAIRVAHAQEVRKLLAAEQEIQARWHEKHGKNVPGCFKRKCANRDCGRTYYAKRRESRTCSDLCRAAAQSQRRRDARRLALPTRPCPCCGTPFKPTRADQKFCGDACRQRNHRAAGEGTGCESRSVTPPLSPEQCRRLERKKRMLALRLRAQIDPTAAAVNSEPVYYR